MAQIRLVLKLPISSDNNLPNILDIYPPFAFRSRPIYSMSKTHSHGSARYAD